MNGDKKVLLKASLFMGSAGGKAVDKKLSFGYYNVLNECAEEGETS